MREMRRQNDPYSGPHNNISRPSLAQLASLYHLKLHNVRWVAQSENIPLSSYRIVLSLSLAFLREYIRFEQPLFHLKLQN